MEAGQESVAKQGDDSSQIQDLPRIEGPSRRQSAAWLLLCIMLVGAGLYILANYLRALAWALILAVALWPFYERVRRQASPAVAKEVLPILFTALVGSAVILPIATLAVDALREVHEIMAGRSRNRAFRSRTSSLDYLTEVNGPSTGGTSIYRMLAGLKRSFCRRTHRRPGNLLPTSAQMRSIAWFCSACVC
jgi:hypothetical protein